MLLSVISLGLGDVLGVDQGSARNKAPGWESDTVHQVPSVYSKLIRDQDNKSQATSGDMHIVVRWKQGKSQARPFKIAEASGAQSGTESLENFMCVTESA